MAAKVNAIEVLIHSWDLATAIGGDTTLDPEVAAMLYDFARQLPLDGLRVTVRWAPQVAVPPTAPAAHQLLGLLGRQA